ncbi:alpha/beta fold hydrolase [Mesobacillus maritimus]|uniref:Alpha/beta hydrolase n=1 Tax=Mesobacillus maritimus TaxID=1643336 RepID=A0ABS7K1U5_9BACI|nr:alpha/beta hydrolase [Mesobacillus maritimus]MBY0096222.1 alpha/beta hydrolase [Mesobacillus maritimus]
MMLSKKTLQLKNQSISYIEEGSSSDPAVLLIHGVPESSMLWKHLIPEIASQGFRSIAPDLPGFGQSDRFPYGSTWEKYVAFISDFMEALSLEKVHLVVHDWGGMIGLRWACEFPEKVESLIISDTCLVPGYRWHPLARKWRTPELGERVVEAMANKEAWMTNMKKEIPSVDEDILEDFFTIFEKEETRNVILELYRSANLELVEHYQNLTQIKKPVTILWGENDPYIPTDFAYKTRDEQFPHATIEIIPNTGHFIHVEAPEQVIPFVNAHYRSVLKLLK